MWLLPITYWRILALRNHSFGTGEKDQWLKARIVLTEDPNSVHSTQMVAHNHLHVQVHEIWQSLLISISTRHTVHMHPCRQNIQTHKINKSKRKEEMIVWVAFIFIICFCFLALRHCFCCLSSHWEFCEWAVWNTAPSSYSSIGMLIV